MLGKRNAVKIVVMLMAFLLCGSCPLRAECQAALPAAPESPTMEDCARLSSDYHRVIQPLFHEWQMCARERGVELGRCSGCASGYSAYGGCCGSMEKRCDLEAQRHRDVEECRQRARANEARDREQRARDEELATSMNAGNDLYDSFDDAYQALSDPARFFADAVGKRSGLYTSLFGPEGDFRSDDAYSEAGQIYRYLWNQAHAGTSTNPVIGHIQDSSLNLLETRYAFVNNQLNEALAAIERPVQAQTPARLQTVKPTGHVTLTSADCHILDDQTESAALRAASQADWIELVRRCKG